MGCQSSPVLSAPTPKPNILFIAVDDLNDWIGVMGGHPQTRTPNMDRLAKIGVLFTNAHCPGNACNPSRSAIMTGIAPNVSGMYRNEQSMRMVMPDAPILPQYFRDHGYTAMGSGKILHYFIDAPSWDEYFPKAETENPFPRTLYPEKRPVSLPVGGPWQYRETDWGPLDVTDAEFGGDYLVSEYVGEKLSKEHDKPFFLACGIYRPHEPWFVPKKYFDMFPLQEIQLPPGYLKDDIDDLPPMGKRIAENRYFAHIREHGQWKQAIQGYLASIAFADAMLGRVLDELESGPNADNTIVVLWSDHGWHLGEKQHWQKFTAWRACTRVPLMVKVPEGISKLKQGTTAGTVCDEPVSLLSLFPTLVELAGLPKKQDNDGPSLLPLLEDAEADWPHVAVTFQHHVGSFSVSDNDWRYIYYTDGGEELYNIRDDPYEWINLASKAKHAARLTAMRALSPTEFVPMPQPNSEQ
jgi:arylsulfatase A-like enzyme